MDAHQGRQRHPTSPGAFWLPHAEERFCVQEHERRMAEGLPKDRHHRWGTLGGGIAIGGYFTQSANHAIASWRFSSHSCLHASMRFMCNCPHSQRGVSASQREPPNGVSAYSTRGGTSL